MADNSSPNYLIPIIAVGIAAILAIVVAFSIAFSLPASVTTSTPTAPQPTLIPANEYQPEVIPPLLDLSLTQRPTATPTNTPFPTHTPFVPPTFAPTSQLLQLPDLIVTGLNDLDCATEYEGTKIRFTMYVRNIGRASTRTFGRFDTTVYVILGQRKYSLDEWDKQFDGVVGSSVTEVFNLNPHDDIKFTVVIDLIGNKDFGIEVVANSGETPIPELDTTNNTLIKYFSAACY